MQVPAKAGASRTAPPCANPLDARFGSDDGYRLWLRYERLAESPLSREYREATQTVHFMLDSDTRKVAAWELEHGLFGLLGQRVRYTPDVESASLVVATPATTPALAQYPELRERLLGVGQEGFLIERVASRARSQLFLAANSDLGLLYAVFVLLRRLMTHTPLAELACSESPRLAFRMLNHWDNLDGSVERGYAGASLWDWHKLPGYVAPRYTDYARANASIGINAVCLTNVNANALILTKPYLEKVSALARVFRPYGMRVFLTARFNAPSELGGLASSDPELPEVASWWRSKATEIYEQVPDFGGFLVKANSEGQPGPNDYGRTQAAGANLLAEALAPHGGIVIWRAFVYDDKNSEDRHKQAFLELVPLDGSFRDNACLQVKNGPIDFQPREPFHPIFGAMPKTPLFLEFQITQEYLGCATHLVYLGPLFKETLDADTHRRGPGSTVAHVIAGELSSQRLTGMAGVTNIGDERNWCGHPFAAANWYAFGRLAWNPALSSQAIADEWLRMTFGNDPKLVEVALGIMQNSREAAVKYMTPLGLHHLMAEGHHYGPGPWVTGLLRADWTATYYHRADAEGLGFERTEHGTNALEQYAPEVRSHFENPESCPLELLLWFHHVGWDTLLPSGRTLWHELCHQYSEGVRMVAEMRDAWLGLAQLVDPGRFEHVRALLEVQLAEANWWRNACLLYFQTFAKRPLPAGLLELTGTLREYMDHKDHYVPGI